jgi:acyl-CoA synthetase (AMP-forming)/AMP-acid ligase II
MRRRAPVPAGWWPSPLVLVDAIARNATGKVMRSTLEALYAQWVRDAR